MFLLFGIRESSSVMLNFLEIKLKPKTHLFIAKCLNTKVLVKRRKKKTTHTHMAYGSPPRVVSSTGCLLGNAHLVYHPQSPMSTVSRANQRLSVLVYQPNPLPSIFIWFLTMIFICLCIFSNGFLNQKSILGHVINA